MNDGIVEVSFVIPAYNEASNIFRCMDSIHREMKQTKIIYEIILADNESSDDTAEIALSNGARLVRVPRGVTVGGVRNLGVEHAIGKTLVFLDADIELSEGWREGLYRALASFEVNPSGIWGSFCTPPKTRNYFIEHWFSLLVKKKADYLGTAHLLTTRTFFNQLNGFNPDLQSGEDYDFCSRGIAIGGRLTIDTEMVVYHHDYPLNISDFVSREAWHGAGDLLTLRRFFSSKVALVSVIYLSLHIFASFYVFYDVSLALLFVVMLLILISLLAFLKLGNVVAAYKALPIVYLYYLGRSVAVFRRLKQLFGNYIRKF